MTIQTSVKALSNILGPLAFTSSEKFHREVFVHRRHPLRNMPVVLTCNGLLCHAVFAHYSQAFILSELSSALEASERSPEQKKTKVSWGWTCSSAFTSLGLLNSFWLRATAVKAHGFGPGSEILIIWLNVTLEHEEGHGWHNECDTENDNKINGTTQWNANVYFQPTCRSSLCACIGNLASLFSPIKRPCILRTQMLINLYEIDTNPVIWTPQQVISCNN